jgi:hypothetical protein
LRVLLVKPRTLALHFGLAPFFQTEPLGLEYISAALGACGHQCFERRSIAQLVKFFRPVELCCETWWRTVLNAAGRKLMDPLAYLAKCNIPTVSE